HARRDLRPGPAEEDLVGDEELGAIDRALGHGEAELLARDRDDRVTRDALEDVVGHRGSDELAVADHEQVRAAALGHVAVAREEDRLVGVRVVRLVHRESGVDVRAGQLSARRDRVIGGAPPGCGAGRAAWGRPLLFGRERGPAETAWQVVQRALAGASGILLERPGFYR